MFAVQFSGITLRPLIALVQHLLALRRGELSIAKLWD
jgi:hypothetical protein